MKKQLNKKTITILVVVAIIASCFVAGTYAWFTAGAESETYSISGAVGHKVNLDLNASDATCEKTSVSFYEEEPIIGLPEPSRNGYVFVGWYTDKNEGDKVTADKLMPNEDMTVYAHWDVNHFAEDTWGVIKDNVNSGLARTRYVVGSQKQIDINGKTYTLRLVNNSDPNGFIVEFIDLFKIEKFGTTSAYKELTERLNDIYNNLPEDLKAVISDSTFDTITQKLHIASENQLFNTEGYIENTPADKNYFVGEKLGELPTPSRDGYKFLGWFTKADGGEEVTSETVVNDDMTIYPHWEKIEETKEVNE